MYPALQRCRTNRMQSVDGDLFSGIGSWASETLAGESVDVADLRSAGKGRGLETQAGFLCCRLEAEFLPAQICLSSDTLQPTA